MIEVDNDIKKINEEFILPDYCQWVRENIQESKLLYAKNFISGYDNYFNVNQPKMIEHCYRACKNSIKIRYAYEETVDFIRMLIYLLSKNKEFDQESDVEKDLLKSVGRESFLYNYFNKAKTGIIEQKGNYYLFDKVALTWLGGNVLFFYIITSVVYIIEKSLTDKNYKFKGSLDWQEAIANYVIGEFIHDRKEIRVKF